MIKKWQSDMRIARIMPNLSLVLGGSAFRVFAALCHTIREW